MAMNKTYNGIIKAFKDLCDAHPQVGTFINNHPLQVNSLQPVFPVVALYPAASRMDRNAMRLTFKFFVMDLLTDGYTNEAEVISDMLQIGNDFIQQLYKDEDTYGFTINEETITMEPFAENFNTAEGTDINDDVAGWYFTFEIELQNDFDECILPFVAVGVIPEPPAEKTVFNSFMTIGSSSLNGCPGNFFGYSQIACAYGIISPNTINIQKMDWNEDNNKFVLNIPFSVSDLEVYVEGTKYEMTYNSEQEEYELITDNPFEGRTIPIQLKYYIA